MYNNDTEFVGGLLGDAIDNTSENIKNGIIDGFTFILDSIISVVDPLANWGCKIIIVYCFLVYIATKDKKVITVGVKVFFIYLIYLIIRSVM